VSTNMSMRLGRLGIVPMTADATPDDVSTPSRTL
jgi:hypothetical protein